MTKPATAKSLKCSFREWGDKHPLGSAVAFFGIWLAALIALSAASPLATRALSGMPAETRLFLEGISLASVAIPAIACPLLLGGSAGRHFTAVQVVLRFIGGLVAGAAWFALAFGALAALGVVDTGASLIHYPQSIL